MIPPSLCSCLLVCWTAVAASAAVYEVGPGRALSSIGQVPWSTLQPGDEVLIHWRAESYREKWVLARQGTAANPIVVRGVPGPQGQRPVIEGANAVTAPGLNYWSEDRGILKIGGSNTPPDVMPRHLIIEGLEFRGANSANTFTSDTGSAVAYRLNAAGIYLEKGEDIAIRNCEFTDNGNGLFVASSDSQVSRNILIAGNYFHGNSNPGRNLEHNAYTAALGIVYEYNRFGPVKPGAGGAALKDRSAGTVVRYNWIEGGNRQLDLVEAEDSARIRNDPSYRETYVYGNVLIEPAGAGNRQMVHYGGDNGDASTYRKGVLYFYNNTLVSTRTDRNTLFRLSTNGERADVRNNIFYTTLPGSDLSLLDSAGLLDLDNNWIKPGWRDSFNGSFSGVVTGSSTMIEGGDPGFQDGAGQDFRLAPGSPLVDQGVALHPASAGVHDLLNEYLRHQGERVRSDAGTPDVGALPLLRSPVEQPVMTAVDRPGGALDLFWEHPGSAHAYIVLGLQWNGSGLQWQVVGVVGPSVRSWRLPAPIPGCLGYLVAAYRSQGGQGVLSAPSSFHRVF